RRRWPRRGPGGWWRTARCHRRTRGARPAGGGRRAWPTVVSALTTAMTSAYIARWGPPSVSPAAAGFARAIVAGCGDLERERAKSLLWAAGRLADWGIALRLDPVPQGPLPPSSVGRVRAPSPRLSPPPPPP